MAQLGIAPLRITPTANTVTCSCCGATLKPTAAGAKITAHYEGPTLSRVVVHAAGAAAHDCDTDRPAPTDHRNTSPAPAAETDDPGDF